MRLLRSKSFLISLGLVAVVSLLAAIRPPVAQYPVVQVALSEATDLRLRVVLNALPTAPACHAAVNRVVRALTKVCKTCEAELAQCVTALEPTDLASLSAGASEAGDMALVALKGGVIQVLSSDAQLANGVCQEAQKKGVGICQAKVAQAASSAPSASLAPPNAKGPSPIPTSFTLALFLLTTICLAYCLVIVATSPWHGRFTLDQPSAGVQKFHIRATPRVGGLAIYAAMWTAWALISQGVGLFESRLVAVGFRPELGSVDQLLFMVLVASAPAFLFGLAEDVTRRVGVAARLLATFASAILAWWMTGISLTRLDVPVLDQLVVFLPFSLLFTAFAVGGVANALNIVDGFHGLASGFFTLASLFLGLIALELGDIPLATVAFISCAVCLGFFLVNYPWGRLFMGDGGAYFLGFWLAWLCVLLPMRNPGVSPWVGLLVCAYPVIEVVYSISRRLAARSQIGEPDRAHLHSLVKRWLLLRYPTLLGDQRANAAVAPGLWILAALPMLLAWFSLESLQALVIGFALMVLLYGALYRHLYSKVHSGFELA